MLSRAEIQLVRSLSDKKHREREGLYIVEGAKMVREAIDADAAVHKVYAVDDGGERCLFGAKIPVEIVSSKEMERISALKTPSDMLAVVRIDPAPEHGVFGEKLTVFLDGVQDPGNLGTIIRIADWFGIENVVCSYDCADCYNPKVIQATMGAIFRVKVYYAELAEELEKASLKGVQVYGTFLEGDDIYESVLTENGIIVLGSEGRGISKETESKVHHRIYIPPHPKRRKGGKGAESLNVAVAAAIVCAEFRRRA